MTVGLCRQSVCVCVCARAPACVCVCACMWGRGPSPLETEGNDALAPSFDSPCQEHPRPPPRTPGSCGHGSIRSREPDVETCKGILGAAEELHLSREKKCPSPQTTARLAVAGPPSVLGSEYVKLSEASPGVRGLAGLLRVLWLRLQTPL